MRIKIIGRSKKKVKHDLIRAACRFYASKLFTPADYKKVKVRIELLDLDPNLYGEAPYRNPKKTNYNFVVQLRRDMSERILLSTLAHEMGHVRQYCEGDLKFSTSDLYLAKWRGEVYDQRQTEEYWLAPFEIEARGLEDGLTELFKHYRYDKGI